MSAVVEVNELLSSFKLCLNTVSRGGSARRVLRRQSLNPRPAQAWWSWNHAVLVA
jgi:hypothetical protein